MQLFGKTPSTLGRIHFVGIGGIGMSALAEILHEKGYLVQGSDSHENANVKRLKAKGIHVFFGHAESHIDKAFRLVTSSAVSASNPEVLAAKDRGVRIMHRSELLAEILRHHDSVAVSGTHGKTTTTALIYTLLEVAGKHPGVVNGGVIYSLKSNAKCAEKVGLPMVAEADESDGSFTKLMPRVAVITNMDPEHLDYYGDVQSIHNAYKRFALNTPEETGAVILGIDHPDVSILRESLTKRKVVTFGLKPDADLYATDIIQKGAAMFFTLNVDGQAYPNFRINTPGVHNVLNAMGAIAAAREYGVTIEQAQQGLLQFRGVGRRFIKLGEVFNASVIDDYAHHPVEVEATLKAARGGFSGKVIAVFQPHRYTRLRDHMSDFASALSRHVDAVILAPVYAAGEKEIDGCNSAKLEVLIKQNGMHHTHVVDDHQQLAALLSTLGLKTGDALIFMGAGNINQWAGYVVKSPRV